MGYVACYTDVSLVYAMYHYLFRKEVVHLSIAPFDPHTPYEQADKHRRSVAMSILCFSRNVLTCIAVAFLFCSLIIQPIRVQGESMKNTLQNGELMLVSKYDYILGDPSRFDVVICHFPGEGSTKFVKRIIGMPGDIVFIQKGVVYINNEPLVEPYIDFIPNYTMPETTIKKGHYFVLGDNRASSMDSHIVGQLTRDKILGHVQQVVWPFTSYRAIE